MFIVNSFFSEVLNTSNQVKFNKMQKLELKNKPYNKVIYNSSIICISGQTSGIAIPQLYTDSRLALKEYK